MKTMKTTLAGAQKYLAQKGMDCPQIVDRNPAVTVYFYLGGPDVEIIDTESKTTWEIDTVSREYGHCGHGEGCFWVWEK